LLRRWRLALSTAPRAADWAFAAAVLLIFSTLALPFGLTSGVLTIAVGEIGPRLLAFALIAVVVPSLAEELAFRVTLLPQPSERASVMHRIAAVAASVMLFVAWHPLNATLFLPAARPLFSDARFLTLAGLLGLCCSVVYLRTGSVWPGVALHWLVVVTWKAVLGGRLVLF
jgi:predicted Abi (CAAX) family protease